MSERVTVEFNDDDTYAALRDQAERSGRELGDIVVEAVQQWLENKEDAELSDSLAEARAEWNRSGGVDAGQFFHQEDGSRS